MTAEEIWWVAPVGGAIGGFLAGMLGVGGGIIFIPILNMWFSKYYLPDTEVTKFALANSIFLVFVSGLMAIIRQAKNKNLELKKMLSIGLPGALVSLTLSILITQGNWYKKDQFQMVFLCFLVLSILNMLFSKKKNDIEEKQLENGLSENYVKNAGVGLLAGSVVALSGLGGGVIMVPLFRMILKMPMKKATVLSISIVPVLSLFPLINNLIVTPSVPVNFSHTGYIAWKIILPMAAGVALFAGLGMRTGQRIPAIWLRIIFASLSLFILVKTLIDFK